MEQTRAESLIEQSVSIFFKFWVSVVAWKWGIAPLIELGILSYKEALPITIIFTVLSLVQGYFWRRIFNRIHLKKLVHYAVRSHI